MNVSVREQMPCGALPAEIDIAAEQVGLCLNVGRKTFLRSRGAEKKN